MKGDKFNSYLFWKKISNISAFTCGFVAIVHTFFRESIKSIVYFVIFIEVVTICVFFIAEVFKFLSKKKK